jgi:peptide chain release factor 1
VSDLDTKLAEIAGQYDELQAELTRPETSTDPAAIRRLGQELSRLEPVVAAFRRLEATRAELAGARELRDGAEADDELRSMAREEIDRLEGDETRLLDELKVLLLPRDPNDSRDVIMEIRGGAGGDEAALFAAELYRMYVRYAERHRFTDTHPRTEQHPDGAFHPCPGYGHDQGRGKPPDNSESRGLAPAEHRKGRHDDFVQLHHS